MPEESLKVPNISISDWEHLATSLGIAAAGLTKTINAHGGNI